MANMKYCRFENTVKDMEECIEALEENNWDLDFMIERASSNFEARAMKKFIAICKQVSEMLDDDFDFENETNGETT